MFKMAIRTKWVTHPNIISGTEFRIHSSDIIHTFIAMILTAIAVLLTNRYMINLINRLS